MTTLRDDARRAVADTTFLEGYDLVRDTTLGATLGKPSSSPLERRAPMPKSSES